MKKKVLLFVNNRKPNAESFADSIISFLNKEDVEAVKSNFVNYNRQELLREKFDIVITLGGDGTLLKAIHDFHPLCVPFFAINNGTLGFITPYTKTDWKDGLKKTLDGSFSCSRRILLKARHLRKNRLLKEDICVNEVYLHRPQFRSVIRIKASVNDEVFAGPLCADGVIVATPTGSTAYSMAAGASILSNDMKAFLFMPNNPFMSMDRGLVFTDKAKLRLTLMENEKSNDGIIDCDGMFFAEFKADEKLEINIYEKSVLIIKNPSLSEFERIGNKLEWLKK